MIRYLYLINYCIEFFILLTILLSGCSNPGDTNDKKEGWALVWQDEFNGAGEVDLDKWDKPEYNRRNNDNGPDGWWLKENSYQDGNGNLVIKVNMINNRNSDNDQYDYATGAIRSLGKFEQRFGKFEVRCKLPTQPGWWVAFWLYSTTVVNVDSSGKDGTEIDIMEGFGWTDKINQALHWDGYGDDHKSVSNPVTTAGIRNGYHTYGLEWNENEYIFYIDSVETWRTSAGGVSRIPEYVKITGEISTESWAVSEWWANNPQNIYYPDYFMVDWVRVWELNE